MNDWEWQLLEDKKPISSLLMGDVELRPGSKVILRPRPRGDVMDIALAGKAAVVEGIEQDYEGKHHVCVVVDDDPGRDIGLMRQPGHRFFFDPEEIEPITESSAPRILVAGIGNIFLGDDAFGVEVVRRMAQRTWPDNIRIVDFGIRGFDLAFALLDGYDVTIMVDACPGNKPPGTLYLIEPDVSVTGNPEGVQQVADAHSMHPLNVLRLATSMGGPLKRVLLVGCEPETLGPDEGQMGLSETLSSVIDDAVRLVESLIMKLENKESSVKIEGEENDCGARI